MIKRQVAINDVDEITKTRIDTSYSDHEIGLVYEKSCGAVIYRNKDGITEFLLIKSKDDDYWGFPKGHMEENEDEIDTALREAYEETGLSIEIVDGFRGETEFYISTNILKKVVFFIGIPNDAPVKIQIEEVDDYRWMTYENAINLFTFESDKYILRSANEFLHNSI